MSSHPVDEKLIKTIIDLRDRHGLEFKAIAERVGMRPASVARIYRVRSAA